MSRGAFFERARMAPARCTLVKSIVDQNLAMLCEMSRQRLETRGRERWALSTGKSSRLQNDFL